MTQKSYLFKCQRKKKSIPPNRHGNAPQTSRCKFYFIIFHIFVEQKPYSIHLWGGFWLKFEFEFREESCEALKGHKGHGYRSGKLIYSRSTFLYLLNSTSKTKTLVFQVFTIYFNAFVFLWFFCFQKNNCRNMQFLDHWRSSSVFLTYL